MEIRYVSVRMCRDILGLKCPLEMLAKCPETFVQQVARSNTIFPNAHRGVFTRYKEEGMDDGLRSNMLMIMIQREQWTSTCNGTEALLKVIKKTPSSCTAVGLC